MSNLNSYRNQAMYLGPFNSPNTYHVAPAVNGVGGPYMPGLLGQTFNWGGGGGSVYTFVLLDASATTPAVGQLLYWRDKSLNTVTNVPSRAVSGGTTNAWRNEVAGVLMVAATAGDYIFMLINGSNIPVACLATNGIGDFAISADVSTAPVSTPITVGTAPTYKTVGVYRSISSGNLANVDVALGELG